MKLPDDLHDHRDTHDRLDNRSPRWHTCQEPQVHGHTRTKYVAPHDRRDSLPPVHRVFYLDLVFPLYDDDVPRRLVDGRDGQRSEIIFKLSFSFH